MIAPQNMPSPDQVAAMAGGTQLVGGGMGVPSGSMSMGGLPPLNLDMGPSMPVATIGNTETGGQETTTGNGAFVFKGTEAGSIMATVQGLLPLAVLGGLAVFAVRRFT